MIKSYFNIVLFLISIFCYSQIDSVKIINNAEQLKNCSYKLYIPPIKIKMTYKDTLEAKNNTPEELMTSIISATNQKWVDYNTFGGQEKATTFTDVEFAQKVKYRNSNYIELLSKLEFAIDSIQYVDIKFNYYIEQNKKSVKGSILMRNLQGRWYQTSNAEINNVMLMMLVFKEDILGRLLIGKGINKMENELISIVYKNGLDVDILFQQNFTLEQKDYFINKLNW